MDTTYFFDRREIKPLNGKTVPIYLQLAVFYFNFFRDIFFLYFCYLNISGECINNLLSIKLSVQQRGFEMTLKIIFRNGKSPVGQFMLSGFLQALSGYLTPVTEK